jgi:hypothetical protein
MSFNKCVLSGLTALAGLGLASGAFADGRNPGSLLLYPEFDNRVGDVTVLTITNVGDDDVLVEFKYIGVKNAAGNYINCAEFNRLANLTGNDTLTLLTRVHNPQQEQGYVYAFARQGSQPIANNTLIGQLLVINGIESFDYSMNAVAFEGFAGDLNGNGLRDLDGNEYEGAPANILVPRFFGQGTAADPTPFSSELILIGLAGGAAFDTTVDFLIYNDNEEVFSSEYTFHCWAKVPLLDISGIFSNWFLQNATNHAPGEILGAPQYESGWFEFKGALANSTTTTILNPAVYGALVERAGYAGVADLPWEEGKNLTGKLLARSNDGQF